MPSTPFVLSKGPVLNTLVAHYRDPDRRRTALHRLRQLDRDPPANPSGLLWEATLPYFGAAGGAEGDPDSDVTSHVLADWLGWRWDGSRWHRPTPTSHWWYGWVGEPQPILVRGLRTAVEVSLGLDAEADADGGTRTWSLSASWVCGLPRFEVWVSWQAGPSTDPADGHVQVTLVTPGIDPDRGAAPLDRDPTAHEDLTATTADLDGHLVVGPKLRPPVGPPLPPIAPVAGTVVDPPPLPPAPDLPDPFDVPEGDERWRRYSLPALPLGEFRVDTLSVFDTVTVVDDTLGARIVAEASGGAARRAWPSAQFGATPGDGRRAASGQGRP